ncbi:MAG: response regulator [Cyanobacteria bacterium P01_D01_bin.156]
MTILSPLNTTPVLTKQKPRLLVVDDEPDNLDLLYRTFRREYQVLRAESGKQALEVLENNGEVAVIISDQRMPEMNGTEFLSKTVPDFPDTVRIILTGFTDVEDLVQAINNGQVYRYITKPWEPEMLKQLVDQAADTYKEIKQNYHALSIADWQGKLMERVAQLGSMDLRGQDALQYIAEGWGKTLSTQVCAIKCLDQLDYLAVAGELHGHSLESNRLVKGAIESLTMQANPNVLANQEDSIADALYVATATQSHLVAPVMFQTRLLAIVSLHWKQTYRSLDDVSKMLNLATQQLAISIIALSAYGR